MFINKIALKNFRSYNDLTIDFSKKTNIIYGKNAAGKTNILEAIYFFSTGRSHRGASIKEIIKDSGEEASVSLDFYSHQRDFKGAFKIYKDKKKHVLINDVNIKKISEISDYINVVMFSPEDLSIIKNGPSERRRFLDMSISQIKPLYLKNLNNYIKILAQRNCLLKEISKNEKGLEMLDIWDESLAEICAVISVYRYEFLEDLKEYLYNIHKEISNENLKIKYLCGFYDDFKNSCDFDIIKKNIYEKLVATRKSDINLGITQTGIHRDDILFFIDKKEARRFASQGQQRSIVLSLKLSLAEVIKDIKGDYPIILLDDITSELDSSRREYLKGKIRDKQVLITCTDKEDALTNKDVSFFLVEDRKVKISV